MLRRLRIGHFAIIDALEVAFDSGLTVLTGETGAGKSILVDALHLALGGRAQAEVVRTGCDEASVEAIFDADAGLRRRLADLGLPDADEAGELLIRRVVHRAGRSKVWVNGALCTLGVLEQLASRLCDIASQHEHVGLTHPESHLDLLDRQGAQGGAGGAAPSATLLELRHAYERVHAEHAAAEAERRQLLGDESERAQRADYLAFQLGEIEALAPEDGEDERLASERARLSSAARLRALAAGAEERLYSGEGSVLEGLSAAVEQVAALAALDGALAPLHQSLVSARTELEEAARELGQLAGHSREDPERLEAVDDRLAELRRLSRKHGGTLAALLGKCAAMRLELDRIGGSGDRLAELEAESARTLEVAKAHARRLSAAREQAAAALGAALREHLGKLGMEKARFEIRLQPLPELGPRGAESAEFFFSANPGEELRPLARIASGGELSRVMLAFKRASADSPAADPVDVYIFDEVDSGIGGPTAQVVGRMLKEVSRERQVICITHLPQIAAFADRHLVVRKEQRGGRTSSEIDLLDEAEARAREVARMLSGEDLTPTALKHARELLRKSAN